MVESAVVSQELVTARRLVDLLERDGFKLDFAVWATDEEDQGRLFLVPSDRTESKLNQSIRVATTISEHKEELPNRHDLRYSTVTSDDPMIRAVRSATSVADEIHGVYREGTYIDTAYVLLRPPDVFLSHHAWTSFSSPPSPRTA
jgi:hypothetical protein